MKKVLQAAVAIAALTLPHVALGQCSQGNCGAGNACATGHCGVGGGGYIGRFLSQFHGQGCAPQQGPCLTCENVWDGYCESKAKCLPNMLLPRPKSCGFLNRGCGVGGCGLGGCNPCAPGVGLYGQRACCPPRNILSGLFKRRCATECCDVQVATPGCDGCADGAAAPAAADPVAEPAAEAPVEAPAPPAEPTPDDAAEVPAAPEAEQFSLDRPKSFDWLQRALQLN